AEGEDAHRLRDGWRQHLPQQLDAMTQAWRDEAAWTGMTRAGGLELPADVVGVIGLDEVIVHGWDLAVSTGQTYACPEHLVLAARGFVQGAVARNPNGSEGLFGPPVAVPDDAPPMSRLLGLTGRDPGWSAPATDG
ncbi:MAG TPA: TIGR03086 family metal-binding protein, partial [Candidatus Dormibacteraeota bacterium]|nr:TIGR03086 family metal-binding protein [Candidatus Dormibacteraeota bacterium]